MSDLQKGLNTVVSTEETLNLIESRAMKSAIQKFQPSFATNTLTINTTSGELLSSRHLPTAQTARESRNINLRIELTP